MSVASFLQTIWASMTPTAYKNAIDANFAVAKRSIDNFAPNQQVTPNMTVLLDAGHTYDGTTLTEVAAQSTATIATPATGYMRIDRIVINSAGVNSVITGTPVTSAPVAPAITGGAFPVCQVLLDATSAPVTAIVNSMITDERALAVGYAANAAALSGGTVAATTISASGLISANGGQIKFPATQNPSANANTLDDYEEGTWTPNIGGTATYLAQSGSYVKIGKLVYITFSIQINVIGTGSTYIVSGLPFGSTAGGYGVISNSSNLATAVVSLTSTIGVSLAILSRTAASTADATNAIFKNSAGVNGSASYIS